VIISRVGMNNVLNLFEMIKLNKLKSRYHSKRLVQFLIVAGILFASLIIGIYFESRLQILLFLLIIALGAFIISIRYPPIGPLVLIAGGLFVDIEIGTGTNTSLNLVVILLPMYIGIWFIDMFVREGKIHFIPSRTNPPLIAFVIVSLLAFGIGQLTWFFYARHAPIFSQLGALVIFLLSAGAYILTANVILDIKWLKRLTLIFIVLTAGYILARFTLQLDRSLAGWMPRGSTGSSLWIWMAALAFSQFLLNRDLKVFWRIALLGFILTIFYVAIVRDFGWKSGWIPPLAAIGMVMWIRYPRLRIILAIGGVLAIWLTSADLIQSDQYSYITRIEAWKIILNEIIKVNPLLGLGPANYRFYTPLFPIMGYRVEFNSHNNYIDILAQIGLLGLIAFLWFAWEVFRSGWGLLKKELDGFSQAYVAGALGGLVGMLVAGMLGDWLLPFVYNVGMRGFRSSVLGWIFLGGLVVIGRIAMTEKTKSLHE
jgi:hypothetical protein